MVDGDLAEEGMTAGMLGVSTPDGVVHPEDAMTTFIGSNARGNGMSRDVTNRGEMTGDGMSPAIGIREIQEKRSEGTVQDRDLQPRKTGEIGTPGQGHVHRIRAVLGLEEILTLRSIMTQGLR